MLLSSCCHMVVIMGLVVGGWWALLTIGGVWCWALLTIGGQWCWALSVDREGVVLGAHHCWCHSWVVCCCGCIIVTSWCCCLITWCHHAVVVAWLSSVVVVVVVSHCCHWSFVAWKDDDDSCHVDDVAPVLWSGRGLWGWAVGAWHGAVTVRCWLTCHVIIVTSHWPASCWCGVSALFRWCSS